jgi:hypothetical protein
MTSLLYYYEPQVVFIAMDTLAVSADTMKPYLYISKFYVLPHLAGIMCGTGSGPFALEWFTKINGSMIAIDIPHLDEFTTDQLRILATKHHINQDLTVTIYQFGYSEVEQCFKGYAYRSTNNFTSESLPYNAIGIKPGVPFDFSGNLRVPDDFVKLMKDQRRAEESKPIHQRVYIGGEMHVVHMTPSGTTISLGHRFPDYDSMYFQMCEKFQSPNNAD